MMLQLLENGAAIKQIAASSSATTMTPHRRSCKRSRSFQALSLLLLVDVTGAWVSPTTAAGVTYPESSIMTKTISTTQLEALSVGGNHQNSLGKRRGSKKNVMISSVKHPWWEPMQSFQYNPPKSRKKLASPPKTNKRICKSSSPMQLPTFWKTQTSPQLRNAARKVTDKPKTAPPKATHRSSDIDVAMDLQRHWEHQLRTLMEVLLRNSNKAPSPTTVRITGLTILVLLTHVAVDQWSGDDTSIAMHWAATNAYFVSVLARPLRDAWGPSDE